MVLPLLFLLSLGAIDLVRGVWTKHTLSHIAREAARFASVRSLSSDDPATTASIEARAKNGAVGIDLNALKVESSWFPSNAPGATVQVRVSYDFHPVTALIPKKTIVLSSLSERIIVY